MSVYRSKFRPRNVKDEPCLLASPLALFLSPDSSGDLGPLRGWSVPGPLYVSGASKLAKQLASHGRGLGVPCGSLFKWSVFLPLQDSAKEWKSQAKVPGMFSGMNNGVSLW